MERALLDQFQSGAAVPKSAFATRAAGGSAYRCRLKVYGRRGDEVYANVECGRYTVGPSAQEESAASLFVAMTVTGRGARTRVVAARTPQEATVLQDERRLFPQRILRRMIADEDRDLRRPTEAEILASLR